MIDIDEIKKSLKDNDLKILKSLGQNFLIDENVLSDIVGSANLSQKDCVLEVGPGMGVLTFELAKRAHKVFAIEKDRKMSKMLKSRIEEKSIDNVEVICGDVLELNLPEFIKERNINSYKVVANIPYYITSPIIKLFLETERQPEEVVLLMQKEVAERICSEKGNMSILALSVILYGSPEIIGFVDKESFFPAPKVDSAILKISSISHKYSKDEYKSIFRIIKIGFSAKRKKLLNNLCSGLSLEKEEISEVFEKNGIDYNSRAQDLDVADWVNLKNSFL